MAGQSQLEGLGSVRCRTLRDPNHILSKKSPNSETFFVGYFTSAEFALYASFKLTTNPFGPGSHTMHGTATLLEWKAEGRAEGMAEGMALGMQEARRSDLLKVLRLRFPDVGYDVTSVVRALTDLDQMNRWLEAAVTAPNIDMFKKMANAADNNNYSYR